MADSQGIDPAAASQISQESTYLAMLQDAHLNQLSEISRAQQGFCSGLLIETLGFLPAAVPIGSVMNDNTLEDQTHKMEGPFSSFAHSIENAFSDIRSKDLN